MKRVTVPEIDKAKDKIQLMEHDYLTQNGWKLACDNPASLWLWEKGSFRGVSKSVAITLQLYSEMTGIDL